MKNLYLLLSLSVTLITAAQAPSGYYNSATGTGYTLKTQLKSIVTAGHIDRGYNALWTIYETPAYRDASYENNSSILDIYSENPSGPDSYEYVPGNDQCGNYNSEGDCYNREHLVPQSYFDEYQTNPMKNDPLHVVPTDGWVNGIRGNLPFGVVDVPNYNSTNGSERGSNLNSGYSAGFTGTVFEPIDEFKGDVARSILYFATRYEDLMDNFYSAASSTSTQAKVMFDGSTNKVFNDTFLNIFISWHLADPVSPREIAINNAVYAYQGNRNPYIDNPNYVCQIWTANCSALSTNEVALIDVKIYPNPSRDGKIYVSTPNILTSIDVVNINGQTVFSDLSPVSSNNTYTIQDLPQGFYFIRIATEQGAAVKKLIIE